MKILLSLTILLSALSVNARALYPEEFIKLPSKSYKIEILKDIKMTDRRSRIFFYKGKIVKQLPKNSHLFFCELTNARNKATKISLEKGNLFRFSAEDGSFWKHFVSGRIWRKRMFIWDNDDVQYFSCNDTTAYQNNVQSDGVVYKNIKKSVGNYLKITIN